MARIDFKGIPDDVLNLVLGEGYTEDWTVRSELEAAGEDIIAYDYKFEKFRPAKLASLQAWTKTYVMTLINTEFGDQVIIRLERNPPDYATK